MFSRPFNLERRRPHFCLLFFLVFFGRNTSGEIRARKSFREREREMDCLAMVAMVIDHRKRAIKIKIFPRTTFRNASSSRRRRIFVAFSLFLPSGRANKIEPRKLVNDTKLGKKKNFTNH